MKVLRQPFGKNSEVSLFTLGTMRAVESPKQMIEVLTSAFDAGINHIETAPVYGKAEEYLGKGLQSLLQKGLVPRGGWVITSKILPEVKLREGKEQLREMLIRLKISKIDNLAIHGINLEKHLEWAVKGEGAELLRWAKKEGLINQVGFSSHGEISLIKTAIESRQFNFCSLHVHLLDQIRIPLAKLALKKGMGVMAISPADKGGHLHTPSQTLINDCKPIPPLELAYRFLLSNGISTLTLGAYQAEDLQLAKKLRNSNHPLNKTEESSIARLKEKQKKRLGETFCGQCQACLPCPSLIPISELLRLRNLTIGHNLSSYTKERYNLINRAGHWWEKTNANDCNRCGDCLPRCPHKLPIPELLEDTHLLLKDKPQRRLWD
tara:strand:+ start:3067 stop:4203 length:1137 start_codon:yes stop_codon:yes gene_type:complete